MRTLVYRDVRSCGVRFGRDSGNTWVIRRNNIQESERRNRDLGFRAGVLGAGFGVDCALFVARPEVIVG